MIITVAVEGRTPTLTVTENNVKCTLTLGKEHEIVTKGEDTRGLAKRIAMSHRLCFGKGYAGKEYLTLIKEHLLEREAKEKIDKEN